MTLADVNVLVSAFRPDAAAHDVCRRWLVDEIGSGRPIAVSPAILAGAMRVATHPRIFAPPSSLEGALSFCENLMNQPSARLVEPGSGHWPLFVSLCHAAQARGNPIPDAWIAALALGHNLTLVTLDRDFARFPGLRWRGP